MNSSSPKSLIACALTACLVTLPAWAAVVRGDNTTKNAAPVRGRDDDRHPPRALRPLLPSLYSGERVHALLFNLETPSKNQIEARLSANGLEITRSVIQPLRRFSGERMELKTAAGDIVREKFYGVVMILKYQVKQATLAPSMTFTEKVYLVEEKHDFGLWKFYERSWSPDEQGVWTDVLGLGDETPLPADYRRVLRQELYCDGKLFANSLITFTPEIIDFRPLALDATRPTGTKE